MKASAVGKKKGFSLVELVVVILIIAVLAIAVFAGGSNAIRKSRIRTAESDLHNYDVAMASYMIEQTAMRKSDSSSDFVAIAESINNYLPVGMAIDTTYTLPATGDICNSNLELHAFQTEKEDPWGNPYLFLLDHEERNDGHTEYFITIMTAGPNGSADVGGKLDDDDIFLLLQYQNGTSASHTYNMSTDIEDATGTALIAGESGLSIVGSAGPAPRNLGETMDNDGDMGPGASGGSGGSVGGGAAAHTHSYVTTGATAATCTAAGTKTLKCSKCGATKTETGVALGHSYGTYMVTVEPTCATEGVKVKTCTSCGNQLSEAIPKTDTHSYGEWVITEAPTRTKTGTKTSTCAVEGCTAQKTETIEKVSLTKLEVTTQPAKTSYKLGDIFDKSGMVVTATFSDNTTDTRVSYSVVNGEILSEDQTTITVSFTENGVTQTAPVTINVRVVPAAILYDSGSLVFHTRGLPIDTYGSAVATYSNDDYPWMTTTYSSESDVPWNSKISSIETVVFEDGVKPAAMHFWFKGASELETVVLGDDITDIHKHIFWGCSKLKDIDLSNIKFIGADAFNSCTSLVSVDVSNVKTFEIGAFSGCSALTDVGDLSVTHIAGLIVKEFILKPLPLRSAVFRIFLSDDFSPQFPKPVDVFQQILREQIRAIVMGDIKHLRVPARQQLYNVVVRNQVNAIIEDNRFEQGRNPAVLKKHLPDSKGDEEGGQVRKGTHDVDINRHNLSLRHDTQRLDKGTSKLMKSKHSYPPVCFDLAQKGEDLC